MFAKDGEGAPNPYELTAPDTGNDGGGGGCTSDYWVSGDCNTGSFLGYIYDSCVRFNLGGSFSNNTISNLSVTFSDPTHTVVTKSSFWNSQEGVYQIWVQYKVSTTTQVWVPGDTTGVFPTYGHWQNVVSYQHFGKTFRLNPCTKKIR